MSLPLPDPGSAGQHLTVTTVALPEVHTLAGLLPDDDDIFAWIRRGEGLLGWGVAATHRLTGPERFSRAQRWWSRLCEEASVHDEVRCPGSGPVAFASFGFEATPARSVIAVPRFVIGFRSGKAWLTTVQADRQADRRADDEPARDSLGGSTRNRSNPVDQPTLRAVLPQSVASPELGRQRDCGPVEWRDDPERIQRWREGVANAVGRINAGELDKVVLARDVFARTKHPIDVAVLLERLEVQYSDCWAFSVAGLVGATPELLVRRSGDTVSSRVLAGTVRADDDTGEAGRLAAKLLASGKDLAEHEYAVASVAAALAAHCTDLDVPNHPSILRLANVQHLATDITGLLATPTPVLALAASLHPTAAVCGTPTERARSLIHSLEDMDRDRYAGPVGWMDANGDGEFGIALRCGQIDPMDRRRIRLFAGCGIVAGSHPASELVESEAKLQPMRMALGDGDVKAACSPLPRRTAPNDAA